jgi:hypothetical protein
MKKIVVALLYIAFANVPLLGQTLTPRPLTNPLVDRFEPLSMRFHLHWLPQSKIPMRRH